MHASAEDTQNIQEGVEGNVGKRLKKFTAQTVNGENASESGP